MIDRHAGEGTLWTSLWSTSREGLRLHARDYGPRESAGLPVVCLPGLTRGGADFHELASHLSARPGPGRRVLALDYRGRGRSDYDPVPANYDIRIEAQDTLDVLTAAGVHQAVVVGTSRGGLIAMAIAAMRPALLRGVVLNDIGPVIEGKGLARIKAYVGKLPTPADLDEAVLVLKKVAGSQFTRLVEEEWRLYAARTYRQADGRLVPDYDIQLMQGLAAIDIEKPLPDLWPYFNGLAGVPVLALRGENSDMLSDATLRQMIAGHPDCAGLVVVGEGHAPLLGDRPTLERITAFVTHCESRRPAPPPHAERGPEGPRSVIPAA
jgi:pimeloyl-ACP methyl ester carboxylesterase